MNKEVLREIGMTENEINVYLALLKLGSTTTTNLIKESKVSASKIYLILDRLIEKGLAGMVKQDKKIYYQASNPLMIETYLREKKDKIDSQLDSVKKLVPYLQSLKKPGEKEEVSVFFGWKGLESAFKDMISVLKKGDTQYVIGATYLEDIPTHNLFFERFRVERDKKGIKTKIIFSRVAKGKLPSYKESSLTKIKYIEQDVPTSIDIYKENVLISIMKKNPLVIHIKSKEIADSFMEYFEIMWKIAKVN